MKRIPQDTESLEKMQKSWKTTQKTENANLYSTQVDCFARDSFVCCPIIDLRPDSDTP